MNKHKKTSEDSHRDRRGDFAFGAPLDCSASVCSASVSLAALCLAAVVGLALSACGAAAVTMSDEALSPQEMDLDVVCGDGMASLEPVGLDELAPIDLQILSFPKEPPKRRGMTPRQARRRLASAANPRAQAVEPTSRVVESETASLDGRKSNSRTSDSRTSDSPTSDSPTLATPVAVAIATTSPTTAVAPTPTTAVARVDSVYFGENQSAILVPSPPLDALVALVKTNAEGLIILEGHADVSEAAASALSRRRAEGARAYLMQRGVPAHRVVVRSHGTRSPSSIDTKEAGAQNRRVALLLQTEREPI